MTATVALWLVLVCSGILTYATRLSFILLFGKVEVPVLLQHALRFVPIAVLSAIILPALVINGNTLYLSVHNTRLIAGVIASGVAWRTKNIFLTIIAGLAVLWLLQMMVK
jgi:branched-subunit amino acid transport protein